MIFERPAEPRRVRVRQKFGGIKAQTAFRGKGAVGAETVECPGLETRNMGGMQALARGHADTRGLGLLIAEKTEVNAFCGFRPNAKVHPFGAWYGPKGNVGIHYAHCQVITSGATRPVRDRIPASVSAAAITSAKAD